MRAASLLPLAFTAALVAGCRSEVATVGGRGETAALPPAVPERDLTLPAPAPRSVDVASPVELSRVRPTATPAPAPRPRREPRPIPAPEPQPVAQPLPVAEPEAGPVVHPAPVEVEAEGGRELAPGETVTIIPVSSGPTVEADEDDSWLPAERPRGMIGRGGGTCRPRGGVRGIGIAGRIPVGVPARRLR